MTLQERLKQDTRAQHDQLEQLMHVGEIMQKTLSLTQYKKLLITNYLVHQAYEKTLFDEVPEVLKPQLHLSNREKLNALTLDLQEAEVDEEKLELLPKEVEFSAYEAVGAMYVLEGATLGGNVIYKKLLANPNVTEKGFNFNYYKVYGEILMPNWMQFVQVINNIDELHHDEVVKGANKLFSVIADTAEKVAKKEEVVNS